MKTTYQISGMTCSGCANKVRNSLLTMPDIYAVEVDLPSNSATLTSNYAVSLPSLQNVLGGNGSKYQISTLPMVKVEEETKSFFATYKPVLVLFAYITGTALFVSWKENNVNWMLFMSSFMAGFFLAFSFFKLINLKGFAESYSMYDVIAKKIKSWGYVYAFIELALGVAYLFGFYPLLTNVLTLVVMSISMIGVLQSVLNKKKIQCACLGAVFDLPMSTLTIIEDLLMILMSGVMLILS